LGKVPHRAHAAVEGIEVSDLFAKGTFALQRQHLGLDSTNDTLGDLVLNSEDVGEIAVVALRPEVVPRLCVDKLPSHPDPLAGFSDASLKNVAHTKLARDLLNIDGTALVHEGGITSDDEEPAMVR